MPTKDYADLDEAFGIDADDPVVLAERDDIRRAELLRDTLISQRRAADLRQVDVARRMETTQSRVSALESYGSNPRFSTLQRYARAIGGHLAFTFVPDTATDVSTSHPGDDVALKH